MMDVDELSRILMCWGLEKKEYELVYFLYNNFEIGIPNTYIYKMDQKTTFDNIKDVMENNNTISGKKIYGYKKYWNFSLNQSG